MAEFLARSNLVGSSLRGKAPDVAVILLKGSELGIPPMTALAQIHVIEGKPSCSPELMRALAVMAGHRITFTVLSAETVTIRGVRGDTGDALEITWDMARARGAGLTGKSTWKQYPQAMLAARATSELVRYHFPELGIGYIPEELGATVTEAGQVLRTEPQTLQEKLAAMLADTTRANRDQMRAWLAGRNLAAKTAQLDDEDATAAMDFLLGLIAGEVPGADVPPLPEPDQDGIYAPVDEPTTTEPAEHIVTMRDAFPSAFKADGSRPAAAADFSDEPFMLAVDAIAPAPLRRRLLGTP